MVGIDDEVVDDQPPNPAVAAFLRGDAAARQRCARQLCDVEGGPFVAPRPPPTVIAAEPAPTVSEPGSSSAGPSDAPVPTPPVSASVPVSPPPAVEKPAPTVSGFSAKFGLAVGMDVVSRPNGPCRPRRR